MSADLPSSHEPAPPADSLAVVVSGSPGSLSLVQAAALLARSLGAPWEAVYVETPGDDLHQPSGAHAAEALRFAARNGGTVATVPAATLLDGILEHLKSAPATHLVLERGVSGRWTGPWRKSPLKTLATRTQGVSLHVLAVGAPPTAADAGNENMAVRSGPPLIHYGLAAAMVAATLILAELLQVITGTRSLDLVFLFPVIAVAARLGLGPALLAATLSVVSYNYFLLAPAFSFDAWAPQNLVMAAVFFIAAAYTSFVTGQMRGRLLLSNRSARENASLAALAQRLTRDADWEATAQTLCEHIHGLLDLQTVVFREIDGALAMAASVPSGPALSPIDTAALDWCWAHGEEAGAGTSTVSASDWQFQPLKTSLGTLAILGVARDDGRDPVRPDRKVLLSTIIAQAALAHERLRLEDTMRLGPKAP